MDPDSFEPGVPQALLVSHYSRSFPPQVCYIVCPGIPHVGQAQATPSLLHVLHVTWVWVNTYRYILSGMNIHKSQL